MTGSSPSPATTSIDKALEVCETLSLAPRGMSLTEVAKALGQPRPTVHRLLSVLRRRGYVRQDEDTQRYGLTLKMLDLSFRLLGRSEIRLHAYPILREYTLKAGQRSFIAVPAAEEVTYIWSAGPDEVAMRTAYGKQMPAHCSVYFEAGQTGRRLSCLRLASRADVTAGNPPMLRLGPAELAGAQRLFCTCAPVYDYTGREVARVGVFGHGPDDRPLVQEHNRSAWELGHAVSTRLGYLPAPALESR